MYYTTEQHVNAYECDGSNFLKVSSAMRYMQQAAGDHLAALGCSTEKLYREGMVFLLSQMHLHVHRMPKNGETVTVGTAAVPPHGARFVREFIFDSADGERLISAVSLWLLVHPESRKILRPRSFPYSMQVQTAVLEEEMGVMDLPGIQSDHVSRLSIPVRYSHIDINQHVNNAVYADFICDALPYNALVQRGLHTLAIRFRHEVRVGEIVEISTSEPEEGRFFLTGTHSNAPCFEALAVLNDA